MKQTTIQASGLILFISPCLPPEQRAGTPESLAPRAGNEPTSPEVQPQSHIGNILTTFRITLCLCFQGLRNTEARSQSTQLLDKEHILMIRKDTSIFGTVICRKTGSSGLSWGGWPDT